MEGKHLLENKVLTINDEEKKSLLQKAGISNWQSLHTGYRPSIPWNRLRLNYTHATPK